MATRASTYTAAAMTSAPATTMSALTGEIQSKLSPARETQISRIETPPTMRVAPA